MKPKNVVLLVIIGIVLRIIAAAFLYHTDIKAIYRDSREIRIGTENAYKASFQSNNPLPYPPLIYEFFNSYQLKLPWLFSSYFNTWMNDWGTLHTEDHPKIFRDLLVMKLPMVFADLLIAWLLWKMATKERKANTLFLWLLNPVTIYAIYGTGQFDVIPTLIVLLGVYFWSIKKEWAVYPLIGLAGGLKLFPLLLIPVLFLLDKRKLLMRLLGIVSSAVFFAITLIPVGFSPIIIKGIFSSNLSNSMFKALIDLGNGAVLPISLFVYSCILLYLWIFPNKIKLDEAIFVVLALILGLSRFHPQWIVWISPYFILLLAEGKIDARLGAWFSTAYFGVILLMADNFTNFGLLKAVNNAFDTLSPLRFYVDKTGLGAQGYGFFIAAFLAGVVAITINIVKPKKTIVDLGKVNLLKRLNVIVGIEILTVLMIFILAHIPLSLLGRNLDFESSSQNVITLMTAKTKITQTIKVRHNNLYTIQVLIKNVNLRTKADLIWNLVSLDGNQIVGGIVKGPSVGDDYDLTIVFPRIANSAGKTYVLEFTAPGTITNEEFIFPYSDKTVEGMNIDGKPTGKLAHRTFYNMGSIKDNLGYSLNNILRKL